MKTEKQTNLLIIGAGPFGLSLAGYLNDRNEDYIILGRSMGYWRSNMPEGMFLRSGIDWQFDALGVHSMEAFMKERNIEFEEIDPLPLETYLKYAEWFKEQKGINISDGLVDSLEHRDDHYIAELNNGEQIKSENVVLAIGYKYFKHFPQDLTNIIPEQCFVHTGEFSDLSSMQGKRCLIVGGRQSAFEWSALLNEARARDVQVVYRHDTPKFKESDWSWMDRAMEQTEANPGWYRMLSGEEKEFNTAQFVLEGQQKLAPWLKDRIRSDSLQLRPNRTISECKLLEDDRMKITLDQGEEILSDQIILATGYQTDISRVPFLSKGNILAQLTIEEGCPKLDEQLQTEIPGLFATSTLATRDFGKFFAFTIAAPVSTKILGNAIIR